MKIVMEENRGGTLVFKTFIFCTFDLEGFHRWEEADQEMYLQNCHRHLFKFKCQVEVIGTNREIEFISLRRKLKVFLLNAYQAENGAIACQFDTMSCEDIAIKLIGYLKANYTENRTYIVECSEDGENGAEVMWIPEPKKDHGVK